MEYRNKDEFGDVCRDFDDMRAYLKESVEQRLKDEKRRRDLITGISHDLRTPLTSIIGYLDGLLDGIADTPEKRKSGETGGQSFRIQQTGQRFPVSYGGSGFPGFLGAVPGNQQT